MSVKDLKIISSSYQNMYLLNENLDQILPTLNFQRTTKKPLEYKFFEGTLDEMPPMSYMVSPTTQLVVTVTSDGMKETQNTANAGDVIISGPSREKYTIKKEKFPKLYQGTIGDTVIPEQSPRIVARVDNITEPIAFTAPWGEEMYLSPGDYLVKDGDAGYYRIAKKEYEQTYSPIQ